ncbi:MAG: IS21-like element helper ATPase IstB [Clostridiales bacterium]|nr:IS21-like element helper ATPase IstB [Clostridiales bacterium]
MQAPENDGRKAYNLNGLKRFRLVDIREQYDDLIAQARQEKPDYEEFLAQLIRTEEEGKDARRSRMLVNRAHFESTVSLDDIDYSFNPSLDKSQIEDLGQLHFLDAHENIIIIGPPGVGKSMIATGIGMNACRAGRKVLFANAKDLVDRLYDEMEAGRLHETLAKVLKTDLLIIDELSYIRMDRERESLFFQIIRQRYEKGSLIITTNLPMGRWDELFTGHLAATAILDRLLHHCHVLSITGESYRVKGNRHSVEKRKDTDKNEET